MNEKKMRKFYCARKFLSVNFQIEFVERKKR